MHYQHGPISRVAGYYAWLFPATMLNVYPWGVSLNVVQPLAIDRARIRFRGIDEFLRISADDERVKFLVSRKQRDGRMVLLQRLEDERSRARVEENDHRNEEERGGVKDRQATPDSLLRTSWIG